MLCWATRPSGFGGSWARLRISRRPWISLARTLRPLVPEPVRPRLSRVSLLVFGLPWTTHAHTRSDCCFRSFFAISVAPASDFGIRDVPGQPSPRLVQIFVFIASLASAGHGSDFAISDACGEPSPRLAQIVVFGAFPASAAHGSDFGILDAC